MTSESGRIPGSREPSHDGLGPSGFDPARERPSNHGAILGEALSDIAKAGAVGGPLLDLMCATCAFREGSMPNQMAATGKVALACVLGTDKDEFACHHGMKDNWPTKICAGYVAAKQAPFDVVKAAIRTVSTRLSNLPETDEIRRSFDEWRATVDPDLDDYQTARAYAAAIAMEARSGETEGLDPKDDSAGRQASHNRSPTHDR